VIGLVGGDSDINVVGGEVRELVKLFKVENFSCIFAEGERVFESLEGGVPLKARKSET